MDVLKHGKSFATVDCNKCDCTIGYTGVDVTQLGAREHYNGELVEFTKAFLRCPECGNLIELQSKVVAVETHNQEEA